MKVYKCSVCDYIYNAETKQVKDNEKVFNNLPEDWRCPGCGSHRSCFICIYITSKDKKYE